MVNGLDKFKEYFAGFKGNYIIIGGTACDILEEDAGLRPRATKDIDIILVIEVLAPSFMKQFWRFVRDGDYEQRERGNGKTEYYRFVKPKNINFPKQIEIFSRKPDALEIAHETYLTPIPADECASSLSAILMDDEYYHFTIEHSEILKNIHLASIESLICLKAKAYLDLNERKQQGVSVAEHTISKHKNDIFRLASLLTEKDVFSLPDGMKADMSTFCNTVSNSLPNIDFYKSKGIPHITPKDAFARICSSFNIS